MPIVHFSFNYQFTICKFGEKLHLDLFKTSFCVREFKQVCKIFLKCINKRLFFFFKLHNCLIPKGSEWVLNFSSTRQDQIVFINKVNLVHSYNPFWQYNNKNNDLSNTVLIIKVVKSSQNVYTLTNKFAWTSRLQFNICCSVVGLLWGGISNNLVT